MIFSIASCFTINNKGYWFQNRMLFFILLLSFCSCKKNDTAVSPTDSVKKTTPVQVNFIKPSYNPSGLDTTKLFNTIPVVNDLARTDLYEISGVAASRTNPGMLYIHNDSGNPNEIYLTDGKGDNIGTLTLTPVGNRDWEDIAVGPGPIPGISYVYIGEIGDNDSKYNSVFVYRFPEPDLTGKALPYIANIDHIDIMQFKYPDGPRNAETLMVDPQTKDIFIASKSSNLSNIYIAKYPQSVTTTTTMTPFVQLYFDKATAGDISGDGTEILLRGNQLIWYWKVPLGSSISQALLTPPQVAPYYNNEPQGEGICFAADGSGYYTDTEIRGYTGKLATISFYKRK